MLYLMPHATCATTVALVNVLLGRFREDGITTSELTKSVSVGSRVSSCLKQGPLHGAVHTLCTPGRAQRPQSMGLSTPLRRPGSGVVAQTFPLLT